MTNRIGGYVRDDILADLHRACEALDFCEAIWRLNDDGSAMSAEEMISLMLVRNEAAELIEDLKASHPWLRGI